MLGTTASLTGDAYQAAKLHSESSLQAGEAFEVRGEPLKTSSLPKQCFALRSLASFCLTFFFSSSSFFLFFHPTVFETVSLEHAAPKGEGGANPNKVKK